MEKIKLIATTDDLFGPSGRNGYAGTPQPFMKKGWITWAYTSRGYFNWDNYLWGNNSDNHCLYLEDNIYRITFNRNAFVPYVNKKQREREEYIRQSEIKHKVTLTEIII